MREITGPAVDLDLLEDIHYDTEETVYQLEQRHSEKTFELLHRVMDALIEGLAQDPQNADEFLAVTPRDGAHRIVKISGLRVLYNGEPIYVGLTDARDEGNGKASPLRSVRMNAYFTRSQEALDKYIRDEWTDYSEGWRR